MKHFALALLLLNFFPSPAAADGPADNNPATVRQIPPPGIEITAEERTALEEGLASLQAQIDDLRKKWSQDPARLALFPDTREAVLPHRPRPRSRARIFHGGAACWNFAVHYPDRYTLSKSISRTTQVESRRERVRRSPSGEDGSPAETSVRSAGQ